MATGPRFLALILSLVVSCPIAGAATPASSSAISARVAETHGTVYKRGFVDWEKDEWADPEPAKPGDNLSEGMQVGTGDKSWAEVTWPTVTTRAWANSVFAVAPNQRLVYLLGGQMLFNLDKHRKDKKDFFVWTKVLQARIRGTTVMVQATKDVSRITVLEGVVEVMNRLDRSLIKLSPGAVYEIRTPGTNALPPISQAPQAEKPVAEAVVNSQEDIVETTDETANEHIPLKLDKPLSRMPDISNNLKDAVFHESLEPAIENASYDGGIKEKPQLLLTDLHEIATPGGEPIMVFADPKAETRLYPADARGLLTHPLVQGFNVRLPSLALVQNSLNNLPPLLHQPHLGNQNTAQTNTVLLPPLLNSPSDTISGIVDTTNMTAHAPAMVQNAEILRVPTADQYLVGPLVGYQLPLPPQAFSGYLPAGVLTGPTEALTSNLSASNMRPSQSPSGPVFTNIMTNTQQAPMQGTFIPPTANIPQMTNFVPPTTAPLPQVTNFVSPTAPIPQITNFVPPTASVPTITNFVPPTTQMPQMTNFVPPTATMPTMTMPVVNTFVPPTTTMPVVNSFIPPAAVNTTAATGTSFNLSAPSTTAPVSGFTIQSGFSLPK